MYFNSKFTQSMCTLYTVSKYVLRFKFEPTHYFEFEFPRQIHSMAFNSAAIEAQNSMHNSSVNNEYKILSQ